MIPQPGDQDMRLLRLFGPKIWAEGLELRRRGVLENCTSWDFL